MVQTVEHLRKNGTIAGGVRQTQGIKCSTYVISKLLFAPSDLLNPSSIAMDIVV